eukprot:6149897-Prymnesium_polylepis.2
MCAKPVPSGACEQRLNSQGFAPVQRLDEEMQREKCNADQKRNDDARLLRLNEQHPTALLPPWGVAVAPESEIVEQVPPHLRYGQLRAHVGSRRVFKVEAKGERQHALQPRAHRSVDAARSDKLGQPPPAVARKFPAYAASGSDRQERQGPEATKQNTLPVRSQASSRHEDQVDPSGVLVQARWGVHVEYTGDCRDALQEAHERLDLELHPRSLPELPGASNTFDQPF